MESTVYFTSFEFIPINETHLPKDLELTEGVLPASYTAAQASTDDYVFQHKIMLWSDANGQALQILTPGTDGQINVALPENRFPLTDRFVRFDLVDVNGDKSVYEIRLSLGTMTDAANRVILSPNDNPSFDLGLIRSGQKGGNSSSDLGYIGATDNRMILTHKPKVTGVAGEPVEIGYENSNWVFRF